MKSVTLAIDQPKPEILHGTLPWIKNLWQYKGIRFKECGRMVKVDGFEKYNKLIDINQVFSSDPFGMIADRTGHCVAPLKLKTHRPWQIPAESWTLDRAMKTRVENLLKLDCGINIFWSGGIDSTALLTAFLKYAPDLTKLRVLYSPFSTYEHPEYLGFLKQFTSLETIDVSGEVYTHTEFDGVFVTGDGGDEFNASLDETFIEEYGIDSLSRPWQKFFISKNPDPKFIEFCEEYFALSGRNISTLLEARWWFYATCKNRCIWNRKTEFFLHYKDFDPNNIIPFYDCDELENYFYWNTDKIIPGNNYADWKKPFKQYSYNFDGLTDWYSNKKKVNSLQLFWYSRKNILLNNQRYIFLLNDGSRVATPNLPFFNHTEFLQTYGTSMDYLFNEPD
jgi:hypothetical protein